MSCRWWLFLLALGSKLTYGTAPFDKAGKLEPKTGVKSKHCNFLATLCTTRVSCLRSSNTANSGHRRADSKCTGPNTGGVEFRGVNIDHGKGCRDEKFSQQGQDHAEWTNSVSRWNKRIWLAWNGKIKKTVLKPTWNQTDPSKDHW